MNPRGWLVAIPPLLLGIVLWLAASALGGRREAWDSAAYWALAFPLALLASAVLGWRFPVRPWRWPAAIFFGQFLGMCWRNGEVSSLWPLGLAAFTVLGLPAVLLARLAARWSQQR
jgi:hypothetical protein